MTTPDSRPDLTPEEQASEDPEGAPTSRNLGPQPLAGLLEVHGLAPKDLVKASSEQITHKMVTRGAKGRWLTANVRGKLLRALNVATGQAYGQGELFNYR